MGSQTILLITALLLWPAGFVLLARMRRHVRTDAPTGEAARVSIIIPARNEAHNLPTLLRSIQIQSPPPLEVLVVDDASTDATAAIARELGATVIPAQPLPEGWRGKTWACHQGATAACGERFLFVDADTWLEPDALAKILSGYRTGALSLGPFHQTQRPYEQLSVFFNVLMVAGTVPHGLFGQMLLIDRISYQRVGGHAAVKDHVLENFRLARHFRGAAIPAHSAIGKGILSFRMYPGGLAELIAGWTKGFASGAGHTPRPMLLLIIAWLIGMMLPVGGLLISPWACGIYLLYALQLAVIFRRVGSFAWYTAVFYPVPLIFYFGVFAWSLARSGRQVTWKGRTIHAD